MSGLLGLLNPSDSAPFESVANEWMVELNIVFYGTKHSFVYVKNCSQPPLFERQLQAYAANHAEGRSL